MPVVYFTMDQTRMTKGREFASVESARRFADWIPKKGGFSTLRADQTHAFERLDTCPLCGSPTTEERFGTRDGHISVVACTHCRKWASYPGQYDRRGRLLNHIQTSTL